MVVEFYLTYKSYNSDVCAVVNTSSTIIYPIGTCLPSYNPLTLSVRGYDTTSCYQAPSQSPTRPPTFRPTTMAPTVLSSTNRFNVTSHILVNLVSCSNFLSSSSAKNVFYDTLKSILSTYQNVNQLKIYPLKITCVTQTSPTISYTVQYLINSLDTSTIQQMQTTIVSTLNTAIANGGFTQKLNQNAVLAAVVNLFNAQSNTPVTISSIETISITSLPPTVSPIITPTLNPVSSGINGKNNSKNNFFEVGSLYFIIIVCAGSVIICVFLIFLVALTCNYMSRKERLIQKLDDPRHTSHMYVGDMYGAHQSTQIERSNLQFQGVMNNENDNYNYNYNYNY